MIKTRLLALGWQIYEYYNRDRRKGNQCVPGWISSQGGLDTLFVLNERVQEAFEGT